jgi:hypothetical protein
MAAEKVLCTRCAATINPDWGTCPRCGTPRPLGSGAPTAATFARPPRRTLTAQNYVPEGLEREYELARLEQAELRTQEGRMRRSKLLFTSLAGLALVALPYAVPAFAFLPERRDALMLLGADAALGLAAGALLAIGKGGAFEALLLFGGTFVVAIYMLVEKGFPALEQPWAFVTVAATALCSIVVAAVIGVAIDEHAEET